MFRPFILYFVTFLGLATANVEKTIFLGPQSTSNPLPLPSFNDLYLVSLSPLHPTARWRLNATFPTASMPKGIETWLLLEGLKPGRRYEARICWLATQPTAFILHAHVIDTVFTTPQLLTSLTTYNHAHQAQLSDLDLQDLVVRRTSDTSGVSTSSLLLQIFAAAEYFSPNETLMTTVPPVLVDVILDPYLINVFPRSMVPTAAYILVLAVCGWFLSGVIWRGLVSLADSGDRKAIQAEKKKK